MELNLDEKVVIVTGGASGIGEAIVQTLAKEGAIPVFIDKNQDKSEALTNDLKSKGIECLAIQVDLTKEENCQSVVEKTLQKYGKIDILVNNAGVNDGVGLELGNPQAFMNSLHLNLMHYYNMAFYSLAALKKSKGCILNISSKTAITGQGNTSGYVAAKGAQLALTREWAVELLKYGIRVNAIIPAEVMTPQYTNWLNTLKNPEETLAGIEKNIPFGNRMTTPQEIADMTVFLISNRASHITGQYIFIDGGYVHLDRALSVLN